MRILALVGVVFLVACAQPGGSLTRGTGDGAVCIDRDGDGYGLGCASGLDCNDADRHVHAACQRCAYPDEGCPCTEGAPPVACFLDKTVEDDGTVMCHEGTRYCREASWSACESVFSYPRPDESTSQGLVVVSDGGPERCSDCSVNCFVLRDNLDPIDGSVTDGNATGITYGTGGGLTLEPIPQPPPVVEDAAVVIDTDGCIPGFAPDSDCDGLIDSFDPYPNDPPFITANPTIFLDVEIGESKTGVIDLKFILNTADVYFLIDQTDTMQSVRNKMKSALTSGSYLGADVECADTDGDGQPNDGLKNKGIVGAIRCTMRNAQFGLGQMREIPFSPHGDDDEVLFQHMMDIGTDDDTAIAAITAMDTDRDDDWPDGQSLALYSLVTGEGLYMGVDKPGVLPRAGCPAGRWGYACFRDDAIPIVIMLTDSAQHNGPPLSDRDYDYDSDDLTITAGTTAEYTTVPTTNEAFASAYDMGDLTTERLTFAGTTAGMADNFGASRLTCINPADDKGPDAAFTFELASDETVHFSKANTAFDGVLALYTHVAESATLINSSNGNEEVETATGLGNMVSRWKQIDGDTTAMSANYGAAAVGCGAHDAAPDAAFKFTLSQSSHITLDASGSAFGTAIGLYKDVVPAGTTYKAVTNVNDNFLTAFNLGDAYQRSIATTGATTDTLTIDADYTGTQVGCGASDDAPDAVFTFTLSQPTRLRFDTAGSSFDTVIALSNSDLGTRNNHNNVNTNDVQSSATAVGAMVGQWNRYSGSTQPLAANYGASTTGCGSTDTSPDAVYTFSLATPARIQLNTTGSSFDTVLSLYDGDISSAVSTTLSTNTNETAATATGVYDLGTLNDVSREISGGSTTSMLADYESSVVDCSATSAGKDAVFKFDLATPTTVSIDTIGSSFDTVVSLHDAPPPLDTTTAIGSVESHSVGDVTGKSVAFTGSTATVAADLGGEGMGCSASDAARDTRFSFSLSAATTVEISTEGSAYDTVLGLFPDPMADPKRPAATALATNNNESISSNPKDVGTLDGQWLAFSGSTGSMNNHHNSFGCGTATARDAVFMFTLASTRTVTIDTISTNTAFDTVLGLFNSSSTYVTCDNDSGGGTYSKMYLPNLAAGTYYVVVKGRGNGDKGNYTVSFRDHAATNVTACDNDSVASGGASKLTATLAAGNYYALLKGTSSTASGSYKIRFRDTGYFATHHRVACDDDDGGGGSSQLQEALPAGTYYVVVKGKGSTDSGSYRLSLRDTLSAVSASNLVTCNDDAPSTTASRIEEDLPAGTYHVVVRGKSATGGAYYLELKDRDPFSGLGTLGCNDDDTAVTTSMIEHEFTAAGTYALLLKGKTDADKGDYVLHVRDVTSTATAPTYCSASGGTGGAALIDETLAAGTYYALLKGTSAAAAGEYSLAVRDVVTAARQEIACTDSDTFSEDLTKGIYDVVIKGSAKDDAGAYSLTVGAGSTQSAKFDPPTWSETLAALKAKDVHVMSVLNCHDEGGHGDGRSCDQTISQATTLANATDTLNLDLEPLVVNLDDAGGKGVEQAVVDKIRELAGYLSMDVSVRLVFDPDANPGFIVTIAAVDAPGNGCDGVVGVEFQDCAPGATPTFHITFHNPEADPVPLNPADPNGGYYFRAELIADGRYFVDAVPIYVVPEDVDGVGPPPPPQLPASGSYWQDLPAAGCSGNNVPDWHDLSWHAELPVGTSVSFNACTALSEVELEDCDYSTVATVSGTASCTADTDCTVGYCAANNVCEVITAGTCAENDDCPAQAMCISGACTFPGQPVYVGQALIENMDNGQPFLRMQVTLFSNVAAGTAPIVYDWALTYYCVSRL